MKTLTKLALAAVILTTTFAAKAEIVSGHFRSNGTYVAPYYRTPANGTPYDNLSYRGYFTRSARRAQAIILKLQACLPPNSWH
ncbi:MAG: hypothetical protein HY298_03170 [Verrucomicrobia bacterium]|nr:hypothetical protein [Verrucomicrobiota bacterium]